MTEPRKLAIVFFVVVAFGVVALAIEGLRRRFSGWLALLIVSLILLVLALSIHPIRARDLDGRHAASPLKPWFDQLRSGKGPCCSDADGSAVSDADWESKDGRYRVRLEGQWWDVPDDAVITEPNRAGRTMVWPIYNRALGGVLSVTIRCFIPGPMT